MMNFLETTVSELSLEEWELLIQATEREAVLWNLLPINVRPKKIYEKAVEVKG